MPSFLNTPEEELSPEILIPRLGEALVEKELITSSELQRALEYQKLKAASGQHRLLGRSLLDLGYIDRETLDKVIVSQIFSLHIALQQANQQLEQRVQQRTQDLEKRFDQIYTTSELAQIAVFATDLDELLKRAVALIVERLGFDHAIIYLLDEAGDFAEPRAAFDAFGKDKDLGNYKLPINSHSVVGWVASQNQTLVISDIHQESLFAQSEIFPTARSEVGIPIVPDEKLKGILNTFHSNPDAFDTDTVTTLQTIANLIASHIQNLSLLRTTQSNLKVMEKRVAILETLDLVSKAISSDLDLNTLFQLAHQQINQLMGDVDVTITFEDTNINTAEVSYPAEPDGSSPKQSDISDQGLITRVLHTKSPLMLVEDAELQAAELGIPFTGAAAKSWLGAPLLVGGMAIGAIVARDLHQKHRFDEDDQRFLINLATQIAITVQNNQQLENARAQAERERIANEISSQLWSATDVQSILRTAIKELSNKLGAVEGVIHIHAPNAPNGITAQADNGDNKGSP